MALLIDATHKAPPRETASLVPVPAGVIRCDAPCEEAFLFALKQEPHFLWEVAQAAPPYVPATFFLPACAPEIILSLTILTCFQSPIAQWLSRALARHYHLKQALAANLRIAVHEAIANAVIHGNLGICGSFQDIESFDAYYARINARLHDPRRRFSRILISASPGKDMLTLRVSDEGEGYCPDAHTRDAGRFPLCEGLAIIRKYTVGMRVLYGGRTLEMDFAL